MNFYGSVLSLPIRPDRRGTLATTADPVEIVRQSILSIIGTRQGERVMLPDYGIPDYVFSVVDDGFAHRFAYSVEQQIKRYEPLVGNVNVQAGSEDEAGQFTSASNPHRATISVSFSIVGYRVQQNLIYPIWRLRSEA